MMWRKIIYCLAVLRPPPTWRIPMLLCAAVFAGLMANIIYISRFFSYLSDKPETCMNCHVMSTQYATWQRGDHGHRALCVDCHVPQDNIFRKYAFKAMDGVRHSTIFTLRMEPQVIRIKQAGTNVVQENCLRCHENLTHKITIAKDELCWTCHKETPHSSINSLSAAPQARIPHLPNVMNERNENYPVPRWLLESIAAEKKSTQLEKN